LATDGANRGRVLLVGTSQRTCAPTARGGGGRHMATGVVSLPSAIRRAVGACRPSGPSRRYCCGVVLRPYGRSYWLPRLRRCGEAVGNDCRSPVRRRSICRSTIEHALSAREGCAGAREEATLVGGPLWRDRYGLPTVTHPRPFRAEAVCTNCRTNASYSKPSARSARARPAVGPMSGLPFTSRMNTCPDGSTRRSTRA
jgi:hypothetical protein